jgi:hypothetical protein
MRTIVTKKVVEIRLHHRGEKVREKHGTSKLFTGSKLSFDFLML